MKKWLTVLFISLSAVSFSQTTRNVPSQYSTIQVALNAAQDGDIVLVQPGTYKENIIWPQKRNIKLIAAGDTTSTIIDGQGKGRVINFVFSEIDTSTVIEGFALVNGSVSNGTGGALQLVNSGVTLNKVLIKNSNSGGYGGAIYAENSSIIIKNSIVRNNNGALGGLYLKGNKIIVSNCIVSQNTYTTDNSWGGGGLYIESPNFQVINSTVTYNKSYRTGGLNCYGNGIVSNSIISNNISSMVSGVLLNGNITIQKCNIIENTAGISEYGGAISAAGDINIIDCVVKDNKDNGIANLFQGNITIKNTSILNNYNGINYGRDWYGKFILENVLLSNNDIAINNIKYACDLIISKTMISNNRIGISKTDKGTISIKQSNIENNVIGIQTKENSIDIEYSNFSNNQKAIVSESTSSFAKAENNWWGDKTGSYNTFSNPQGLGEETSDYIDVTPFLDAPSKDAFPITPTISLAKITTSSINLSVQNESLNYFNFYVYDEDKHALIDSIIMVQGQSATLPNFSNIQNVKIEAVGIQNNVRTAPSNPLYIFNSNGMSYGIIKLLGTELTGIPLALDNGDIFYGSKIFNVDESGKFTLSKKLESQFIQSNSYSLPNGNIFVTGIYNLFGNRAFQMYYPKENKFTDISLPDNFSYGSVEVSRNGNLIFFGSPKPYTSNSYVIYSYNPESKTWENIITTSENLVTGSIVKLPIGDLLLITCYSIYKIDENNKALVLLKSLPYGYFPAQIVILDDGKLLLVHNGDYYEKCKSVIYDPSNNTLGPVIDLKINHGNGKGVSFCNGSVIVGGSEGVEFYDKNSNLWTGITPNLRLDNPILLKDGRVFANNYLVDYSNRSALPLLPKLNAPTQNSTDLEEDVELKWNRSLTATKYNIQVSEVEDFSKLIADTTLSNIYLNLKLAKSHKYYWRVRTQNSYGTSQFSDVWSFTTIIAPPDKPVPTSPINNADKQQTTLTLNWNPSSRAEKYILEISRDNQFTTLFSKDTVLLTSKQVSGLNNSATYYWRLLAVNKGGASEYSDIWSFTTIIASPAVPGLLLPENNAVNQPVELPLKWKKLKDAEKYQLQVSAAQDFANLVLNDSTLSDTLKLVTSLQNKNDYCWRVRAINIGGVSPWSEIRTFKTIVALPSAPVLISPSHEASQQTVTLKLSWQAPQDAETYRIILSNNQLFTDNLLDDSTLTATSKEVSGLAHGMKYYWKVRAKNIAGVSNYSPVWSFITLIPSPENLTASASGVKKIKLIWIDVSAGEAGFILERNTDKMPDYLVIDTVQANSTSFTDSTVAFGTKYSYRLKSYTPFAVSAYSNDASVTSLTSVESWMSEIPTEYALKQNYPNPFNPSTMIRYSLPYESRVKIMIFNTLGELVSELVNKVERSGNYEKAFNAGNLPSGIYIYSITVHSTDGKNSFSSVKKMMLVK